MRLDIKMQTKLDELREEIWTAYIQDIENFDFILTSMMALIDILKEGN